MQETRRRLRGYPDLRASVQQVSLVSGGGFRQTPFNLILRGPDLDRLDAYSQTLVQRLSALPGFVDVDTAQAQRSPELQVMVDRQRAADLGVRMADLATTLRILVAGEKVGFYREAGDQYDVRLRIAEPFRRDARALPDLAVPGTGGQLVRLANLAALQPGMSPGQIDRYAQERQVTVVANLYQKPLGEAVSQALAVVRELDMPAGYRAIPLGQAKLMQEAMLNFLIAFVLALAFIYMVLAAQFESFVHPVTIMLSMFLALPFGLLALVLTGNTLNIYAIMGMFLLMGVVKKNAILQVDYTNVLRARGLGRFEAQLQADRARLRPILMTTLAIMAGMLPVALGRGDGSASRAALAVARGGRPGPLPAPSRWCSRRWCTRSSTTSGGCPAGCWRGGRPGVRRCPSAAGSSRRSTAGGSEGGPDRPRPPGRPGAGRRRRRPGRAPASAAHAARTLRPSPCRAGARPRSRPQPAPARPGQPASPQVVEELRAVLGRAVERFEARDLTGVLAHISEQYRTGPFTKPALRAQLGTMFRVYDAMRARVRIDEVRLVGDQAWVYSTGEAAGRLPFVGQWITILWWERELEVARRENGSWRLFGYQQ